MLRRFSRVAAALCVLSLVFGASALAASVPRFSQSVELGVGLNPAGMVATDLNGDGYADLATEDVGSASVSVLVGKGTGNFRRRVAYRTAQSPVGITFADIESDGDPDLVTASRDSAGSISVLVNDGAGRFRRGGTYGSGAKDAYAVAAGDVNHDGIADLVTAHATRDHLTVLAGVPGGHFRHIQSYQGPRALDVALGDLNGDGTLDVALACGDGSLVVRLGVGDGTFGPASAYASGSGPFGVELADLNHDAKLDVAVANWRASSLSVFLGTGNGTVGAGIPYPMSNRSLRYVDAVLVADFDRDGNLDLATPGNGDAAVRRGHGDGTLASLQQVGPGPHGLITQAGAVADFNNDGWPDLAVSEGCAGEDCLEYDPDLVLVYLNWTGQPAPPCVVPPVASYQIRLRLARRMIRRDGCRVGHIGRRYSRWVRKGRVIGQRPRHDTVLPSRARVDLIVSRGRRR